MVPFNLSCSSIQEIHSMQLQHWTHWSAQFKSAKYKALHCQLFTNWLYLINSNTNSTWKEQIVCLYIKACISVCLFLCMYLCFKLFMKLSLVWHKVRIMRHSLRIKLTNHGLWVKLTYYYRSLVIKFTQISFLRTTNGVMVIRNGLNDLSSNPGQGYLHFPLLPLGKVWILLSFRLGSSTLVRQSV